MCVLMDRGVVCVVVVVCVWGGGEVPQITSSFLVAVHIPHAVKIAKSTSRVPCAQYSDNPNVRPPLCKPCFGGKPKYLAHKLMVYICIYGIYVHVCDDCLGCL